MTTTRDRLEYLFTNTVESVEFQKRWTEFAARIDHNVRMIDPPVTEDQRWLVPHVNCFAYSLGLYSLPEYSRWIREHHALEVLNGRFMSVLIKNGCLKVVKEVSPSLNSLVVYYDNDNNISHCGTIFTVDNRVRSKFNVHEFYEHDLLEVQTSFGFPKKYLEPPTDPMRRRIIAKLDAAARPGEV